MLRFLQFRLAVAVFPQIAVPTLTLCVLNAGLTDAQNAQDISKTNNIINN